MEALVSNYFHDPAEQYLHIGGRWVRPQLGEREHRYYVRCKKDADDLRDGRFADFYAETKQERLYFEHWRAVL